MTGTGLLRSPSWRASITRIRPTSRALTPNTTLDRRAEAACCTTTNGAQVCGREIRNTGPRISRSASTPTRTTGSPWCGSSRTRSAGTSPRTPSAGGRALQHARLLQMCGGSSDRYPTRALKLKQWSRGAVFRVQGVEVEVVEERRRQGRSSGAVCAPSPPEAPGPPPYRSSPAAPPAAR